MQQKWQYILYSAMTKQNYFAVWIFFFIVHTWITVRYVSTRNNDNNHIRNAHLSGFCYYFDACCRGCVSLFHEKKRRNNCVWIFNTQQIPFIVTKIQWKAMNNSIVVRNKKGKLIKLDIYWL